MQTLDDAIYLIQMPSRTSATPRSGVGRSEVRSGSSVTWAMRRRRAAL